MKKTKQCNRCQKDKPLSDYHKNKKCKDGLTTYCKCCSKEYRRLRYINNREEELNINKKWAEKNKEKRSQDAKKRYQQNKERLNAIDRQKTKEDPIYKIKKNLRRRILHAIKDNYKSDKTMNLIGCSIEEFMKYIETKFQVGMTWENHGVNGWHIDHIVPCSSFDLREDKQQKQCFHYTNLQPLWAKDNWSKGDKILE
jgi:hypothetical protein